MAGVGAPASGIDLGVHHRADEERSLQRAGADRCPPPGGRSPRFGACPGL